MLYNNGAVDDIVFMCSHIIVYKSDFSSLGRLRFLTQKIFLIITYFAINTRAMTISPDKITKRATDTFKVLATGISIM